MFRPLTILCMLVAAIAGWYLYQVKQSVAQLERELRDVRRQTEAAAERTQVLRAEWALLNEPERLRQVVGRHLALEPMTPAQFIRFSDLPRRIGPPQAFAGTPSLFAAPPAPAPAIALAAAGRPLPARAEAEAGPGTPAPPAAAAAPGPGAASMAAATPAPRPAPRPAPPPRPAAPQLAAAPQVATTSPRPAAPPAAAVVVPTATPAVLATASSTLGMGRPALPPPVPFGAARAATTQ